MRSVLTILAGACCASLALAQPATTTTVQYHRVSTVVGTSFSLGTESVGKVTEVVISDGGCIEYIVIQDSDGFIAVPWSVTTFNFEQKTVTVQSTSVTLEKLRELRFTQDKWPNFGDPTYSQKIHGVWGSSPSRTGPGSGRTGTAPPTDPKGTAPPAKEKPGTTTPKGKEPTKEEPPKKEIPKKDPKKDKDGK